MKYNLAQTTIQLAPEGGFRGIGPLGLEGKAEGSWGLRVFNSTISTAIGVMTVVAIIWFTFQLITGAIAIIGASGDKAKMENAKGKITSALIGLVIVIASVFLIDLIGNLIGIPNILEGIYILSKPN
ncbi:hypothetical protein A3F62_05595 [Candidatus Woesebacteria bacterium RIFCSPHIGHO2_12_FULL_44_11]|nr:MAG: hypothetical protein A3F62_05595 [Candidatus Woesebacteria bacterium RIFCSPHIGHO2_12_FULL_44_11]